MSFERQLGNVLWVLVIGLLALACSSREEEPSSLLVLVPTFEEYYPLGGKFVELANSDIDLELSEGGETIPITQGCQAAYWLYHMQAGKEVGKYWVNKEYDLLYLDNPCKIGSNIQNLLKEMGLNFTNCSKWTIAFKEKKDATSFYQRQRSQSVLVIHSSETWEDFDYFYSISADTNQFVEEADVLEYFRDRHLGRCAIVRFHATTERLEVDFYAENGEEQWPAHFKVEAKDREFRVEVVDTTEASILEALRLLEKDAYSLRQVY